MAYTLRHDLEEIFAVQRRRLTARLGTETDLAKRAQLVQDLATFDAYVDGYLDVHGSDGEEGTTLYAQGGITKVDQMLAALDE